MKIELGSGMQPIPGYTHIDIEPSKNPDIVGDFRKMSFTDLEEIRSHHLLEHFSRLESWDVIRLWYTWLKKGGVLFIETPDFEKICENFQKDKFWMARHAYGSQEADWAYHRDGWWEDKFREILPQIGFKILSIKRSRSRKILPNITVIAEKL